ncbi:mazG nucleotide pyrophosphohydrolase domain protein, partial [Chlamydia psittaci 03DC29]
MKPLLKSVVELLMFSIRVKQFLMKKQGRRGLLLNLKKNEKNRLFFPRLSSLVKFTKYAIKEQ